LPGNAGGSILTYPHQVLLRVPVTADLGRAGRGGPSVPCVSLPPGPDWCWTIWIPPPRARSPVDRVVRQEYVWLGDFAAPNGSGCMPLRRPPASRRPAVRCDPSACSCRFRARAPTHRSAARGGSPAGTRRLSHHVDEQRRRRQNALQLAVLLIATERMVATQAIHRTNQQAKRAAQSTAPADLSAAARAADAPVCRADSAGRSGHQMRYAPGVATDYCVTLYIRYVWFGALMRDPAGEYRTGHSGRIGRLPCAAFPLQDGARHPEMGSDVPNEQRLQNFDPLRCCGGGLDRGDFPEPAEGADAWFEPA
jgi:hypothetical protein